MVDRLSIFASRISAWLSWVACGFMFGSGVVHHNVMTNGSGLWLAIFDVIIKVGW